jgi:chorismate dehydratase
LQNTFHPPATPLCLGAIDFINVLPIQLHLAPDPRLYRLTSEVPSRLNRLLRNSQLDLTPVSSVEMAHQAQDYLLLPGLCLASRGAVRSVLLFSQVAMNQLAGPVEAPFESDTSVALVTLLFRRFWQRPCTLEPESARPNPLAVLRIGDRALKEKASGRWPHVYDLGQAWQDWLGLPFVYAVWAVRQDVAKARAGDVSRLHQALLQSRDQGLADLNGCAHEAASRLGGDPAAYLEYFKGLRYVLGPEEEAGLRRFFDLLRQEGLVAGDAQPRYFSPEAAP